MCKMAQGFRANPPARIFSDFQHTMLSRKMCVLEEASLASSLSHSGLPMNKRPALHEQALLGACQR